MNTSHTPTPWQVNHGDPLQVCDASDIRGCAPIAVMDTTGGRVEAKHNAAFIVRACNAHDDLMGAAAALGDLLHALSVSEDKSRDAAMRKNLLIGARQRARAALAKVQP
jgi:hypothetical protein